MTKTKTNQLGFTLIELLIVIAIIGILATIILVSLNSVRAKARDAQRKSDLIQIAKAYEVYSSTTNSYVIPGTGSSGAGNGWFNYQGGTYPKSMAHGLEENGFGTMPRDPSIANDNVTPQYMKYRCGTGFFVYAKLENPSAADLASYTSSKNAGCANLDTYGMNYAYGRVEMSTCSGLMVKSPGTMATSSKP